MNRTFDADFLKEFAYENPPIEFTEEDGLWAKYNGWALVDSAFIYAEKWYNRVAKVIRDPEGLFWMFECREGEFEVETFESEQVTATRVHPVKKTVVVYEDGPGPDRRPHSKACGINCKGHGIECHWNCPTCHGKPE